MARALVKPISSHFEAIEVRPAPARQHGALALAIPQSLAARAASGVAQARSA